MLNWKAVLPISNVGLAVRMRRGALENGSLALSREGCNSSLLQPLVQASHLVAASLIVTPEDHKLTIFSVNQNGSILEGPGKVREEFVFFNFH
ncbi:hypothetical protein NN561_010739 [Cricetulus griseus]